MSAYDDYRKAYETGYMYGFIDGVRGNVPDSRTPGKRVADEDSVEVAKETGVIPPPQ
jgi:hypothetical protein